MVGIAAAGSPRDDDATWPIELFVRYLLASHHGSGAGQALLEAVIDAQPAALCVTDPNPREQAFYRRAGFALDGTSKNEGGLTEVRMVHPA